MLFWQYILNFTLVIVTMFQGAGPKNETRRKFIQTIHLHTPDVSMVWSNQLEIWLMSALRSFLSQPLTIHAGGCGGLDRICCLIYQARKTGALGHVSCKTKKIRFFKWNFISELLKNCSAKLLKLLTSLWAPRKGIRSGPTWHYFMIVTIPLKGPK